MAQKLPLSIDQGTTFNRVLTINDAQGSAMDLTGTEFRGQARIAYRDSLPLLTFTFVVRNQTTDLGKVDMSLLDTDTSAIALSAPTDLVYDVEMVSLAGTVYRLFEGKLTLNPEATK